MRGCRRILIAAPLFFASRSRKNGAYSSISSGFCNLVESPESLELPDWFMYLEDDLSYVGSDDEFVLPPDVEFSDDSINSLKPPNAMKVSFRAVLRDITAFEVDIEQISRILNSNFLSPEAVLIAIDDGCSIRISKPLVDKILQRFNNDWVPAFGFFMWAGTQRNYYMHSANTYDVMVDILGKFKQFDTMWGLIEEMVRLGGLVSLTTMTKVMRRLAGAGRWNEAINAFKGFEHFGVEKDTQATNVLLDTQYKKRSVRRARDAFLELRSEISPDASSFNTLVHGWCKARKLEEARETMKEMRQSGFYPCVITYTSLIEAYCLDKNFTMVDAVLDEMHAQGCNPNVVTYTIVMHSLGKAKKTKEALEIFDKMKKDGCIPDTSFYNSLVYILGRAGWLQDANNIFEEMCGSGISPNVNTINTLISAFCDHSQEENALKLLVKMEETSCKPDVKTYTPLLKLCCTRQWLKILYFLLGHMLRKDISPDFSTYTLLVNGLCRNNLSKSAICFGNYLVLSFLIELLTYSYKVPSPKARSFIEPIDASTPTASLKLCTNLNEVAQIHGNMTVNGLLHLPSTVSKLVVAYSKIPTSESLHYAIKAFELLREKKEEEEEEEEEEADPFLWNSLIRGYSFIGSLDEALKLYIGMGDCSVKTISLFHDMVRDGRTEPNSVTMACVLSACVRLQDLMQGEKICSYISDSGVRSSSLVNPIIDMYMSCGATEKARQIFDDFTYRDIVLWNIMVSNYARNGMAKEALCVVNEMLLSKQRPDRVTVLARLSASAQLSAILVGKQLHAYILRNGLDCWDVVNNSVIDMYMKCRNEKATRKDSKFEEAVELFRKMQDSELKRDTAALVSVASACGYLGSLDLAKWVYTYAQKKRISRDVRLGTALVDMFSRCGDSRSAMHVFSSMPINDVRAWTAVIGAMAFKGNGNQAFKLFSEMIDHGVKPDGLAFVGVLTAYSHAGSVEEGCTFFHLMSNTYGFTLQIVHYGCLVDLLSRAGLLAEARALIESMPMEPNDVIWRCSVPV
uniref:Pentatricopeptide repeat-containing protein n=1 Tax=Ananas comosus var. bracteatus TaxID=296719 RepID=A0A6V7PQ82_ANACO|nr:unnamed protein product [Ananas comosus var. bracteatus]